MFHDPHLVDAPALGVEHLDGQAVDVEPLAHRRHAAEVREQITADRLESLALDVHVEPLRDLVDVDLAAEHEPAVAFVDDRLRLDVVLVADLADDLLEQILDGHEAGRAAVLVHDDRNLRLLPLELLQELRHPLGLGHDDRRPDDRRDRPAHRPPRPSATRSLMNTKPGDVVEALLEDRKPRVFLLAEERPQFADRRLLGNGDDVGPRRHHLAHERVAEVHDALEQPALLALDEPFVLGRRRRRPCAPRSLAVSCGLVPHRPGLGLRRRAATPGAGVIQRVSGPSAYATGVKVGSSSSSTRSGSRPTIMRGSSSSKTAMNATTLTATNETVGVPSMPMPVASSAVAAAVTSAEQKTDGHEQQQRIVQIRAERAGPIAALGGQPQRQPHQRAERGLDRCRDTTATHARRKTTSGITRRPARSMRPSGRPPCRRRRRLSTRRMRPASRS